MLRGVDGQNIFTDKAEKIRFCLLLQAASEKHDFKIHAFCLMDNHVHLLLEPRSVRLSIGIHAFSFRYAQYFNHKHKRRGYLYQGRYKSILVEDGLYLKRLVRYIHLNPVEAGVCVNPETYMWSSHTAYLGENEYVWLQKDHVLSRFGSVHDQLQRFKEFVCPTFDLEKERLAIRQGIKKGFFGSNTFALSLTEQPSHFKEKYLRISLEEAVKLVCHRFNTTLERLASTERSRQSVDARSVLSLIGKHAKDWSIEDLAKSLGKNSGTLSRLATRAANDLSLANIVSIICEES